jgi:hypothetical protein
MRHHPQARLRSLRWKLPGLRSLCLPKSPSASQGFRAPCQGGKEEHRGALAAASPARTPLEGGVTGQAAQSATAAEAPRPANRESTVGLLARGSPPVTAFPGFPSGSGLGSPLTVAGAAAALKVLPSPPARRLKKGLRTAFPVIPPRRDRRSAVHKVRRAAFVNHLWGWFATVPAAPTAKCVALLVPNGGLRFAHPPYALWPGNNI